MIPFRDRRAAGGLLAERLRDYRGRGDAVVLALPRGGVPVAYEVAAALELPLDVYLVRKLGVPGHEELAMGAIASDGTRVIDEALVARLDIDATAIASVAAEEQRRLEERERRYRGGRPRPALEGRAVLLVDDGLATGSSMTAAARAIRSRSPSSLAVAVPIAPPATCVALRGEADEVVCAVTPEPFYAVGEWYEDFGQTSDEEVCELLASAHRERGVAEPAI
jgi:predicted phosphoribosyltransferase